MNYINNLLQDVTVEWKALGEIFEIIAGGDVPKEALSEIQTEEFNVPILSNGIGDKSLYGWTDKAKIYKPSLTISARGTIGWTSFQDKPFFPIVRLIVLTPKIELNLKYSYYYMKMIEDNYNVPKTGIPQLTKPMIKDIQIPIPHLEVQKEIVRILDTFTELTNELTNELTIRKKQYNYYRDQLLTFNDDEVEFRSLGEVAQYSKTRIGFNQLDKTNYVGVDNLLQNRAGKTESNYVPTEGNLTRYSENDILIGNIRPYLKKIWHADRFGGTNGDVLVIHPTDKTVNPKYLYQVLADDKFFDYDMQHAKGAKMPRGNKSKIMEYPIPIPSLDRQEHIVSILDKFDTLTNSIKEGLPREIELRRQQYEYYREQLLTFP